MYYPGMNDYLAKQATPGGLMPVYNPVAAPAAYTPSSGIMPTYSGPANYATGGKPSLGVSDLFEMRSQPGSAAEYYDFQTDPNSPNYIFGNAYLGKLQGDWAKGIKTGGNEDIYKILTGLGTSSTGADQQFVKANPGLGAQFANFFATGNPGDLNPEHAITAYDYALREQGRDFTRKKEPGLLGSLAKGLIGPVLGSVALGPLGFGLTSAALGGAAGGALQGGVTGGAKGALLGGLSGYGIGSGVNSLTNWAQGSGLLGGGFNSVPGAGFVNPSALGGSGNLYSPAALGAPASGAANALGLSGANLALPGLSNVASSLGSNWLGSTANAGGGFTNPSAIGGNPSSLYNPQSLGGAPTNALGNAAKQVGSIGRAANTAGQLLGGLFGSSTLQAGSAPAGASTLSLAAPLSSGMGSSPTDRFQYALSDALTGNAGQMDGGAAVGNMGAGLLAPTQRDMQRNPGYQPRPFANYLMRG